jgi:hypothetical protein
MREFWLVQEENKNMEFYYNKMKFLGITIGYMENNTQKYIDLYRIKI